MSGDVERTQQRVASRGPDMLRGLVRTLWLNGADTNGIATALGTGRASVAAKLLLLEDAELLAGLRTNLNGLVQAKAAKSNRSRKA